MPNRQRLIIVRCIEIIYRLSTWPWPPHVQSFSLSIFNYLYLYYSELWVSWSVLWVFVCLFWSGTHNWLFNICIDWSKPMLLPKCKCSPQSAQSHSITKALPEYPVISFNSPIGGACPKSHQECGGFFLLFCIKGKGYSEDCWLVSCMKNRLIKHAFTFLLMVFSFWVPNIHLGDWAQVRDE